LLISFSLVIPEFTLFKEFLSKDENHSLSC